MVNSFFIPNLIQRLGNKIDHLSMSPEKENRSILNNPLKEGEKDADRFTEKALDVLFYLSRRPYAHASEVSEKTHTPKSSLKMIYRMLGCSPQVQRYFRDTKNSDYFRIVDHYFNHRLFTIVFFVGTSCPNRCLFCPNVRLEKNGHRSILQYSDHNDHLLTKRDFESIFKELEQIKEVFHTNILVKISGGLEPLTDTLAMSHILELARKSGFYVKLFTNGTLLNSTERRAVALGMGDIRISLSTVDKYQYEWISFGEKKNSKAPYALDLLIKNIVALVKERNLKHPSCKIGLNTIVMPSNAGDIIALLRLASELQLDYVDLKPEYFGKINEEEQCYLEGQMDRVKTTLVNHRYQGVYVSMANSLYRDNFYWKLWEGTCHINAQSRFKLFITPYGHISPIHHGAFPVDPVESSSQEGYYLIGRIKKGESLLKVMHHPESEPEVALSKLNPFELMLHLETQRKKADLSWGIAPEEDPFDLKG